MDRIVVVGRLTIAVGLCELIRLFPEMSSLMEAGPHPAYLGLLLLDLVAGCVAVVVGYQLTQRHPWGWYGSVMVWGTLLTNSAVISLFVLQGMIHSPGVLRHLGRDALIAVPRVLFYGGTMVLGPFVCWTLDKTLPGRRASRVVLRSWLAVGLLIGAGTASWVISRAG